MRCADVTGSSRLELIAARSAIDFSELRGSGALISGVELNWGGPFKRGWLGLASLKLDVGELGGFTDNGNSKLGPELMLLADWEALLVSFVVLGGGL